MADTFRLHRSKCGQLLEAVAQVVPHDGGWELSLEVSGSRKMACICRSEEEVRATSDQWKAALLDRGWT
jgi:hypothetical protein